MTHLPHLFEPGWSPHAEILFTDRVGELEAFRASVLVHLERVVAGDAVLENLDRRNVLGFYGMAGIGKSTLSEHLERWLRGGAGPSGDWDDPPIFDHEVRTFRIDLKEQSIFDPALALLEIRSALAAPQRRFPTFDTGWTVWWSYAKRGQPLPEPRQHAFDVRGQIADTVGEVISGVGAGFGVGPLSVRALTTLVDAVRSGRTRRRALDSCPQLRELVRATEQHASLDVAASLAGLLSWDIERQSTSPTLTVAFVDHVERLQERGPSGERHLNLIVYLTPSILWVLTSKSSLDWADETRRGELEFAGPARWPGLRLGVTEEPCQHRVGDLSDDDVLRFLRRTSDVHGGTVLNDEIVQRIREGAHGLPLYLDLALGRLRQAAAHGTVDSSEFGKPFPEVVSRVFADMPDDERAVARAACLVPRFSPDIMARACGTTVGAAVRLCERTFVTADGHPLFPHRVHDAVAAAVRDEPVTGKGAWAQADRLATARRMLEVLNELQRSLIDDPDRRLDALELAAGLASYVGGEHQWLLEALLDPSGMVSVPARLPEPATETWIGQVAQFFDGWNNKGRPERIRHLRGLTRLPPAPDIDEVTRRFLAFELREANDAAAALQILEELLSQHPESPLYRFQVARTLRSLGRYDLLDEHLARYPLAGTQADRVASDVALDRGDLDTAIEGSRARAEYLRRRGEHRRALENETSSLWRRTLATRSTVHECDALIDEADRRCQSLPMRTGLVSKAMAAPVEEFAAIRSLQEMVVRASGGNEGWREYTSRVVHALRTRDTGELEGVHRAFRARNPNWTPSYAFVDRLLVHAGYPPALPPPRWRPSDQPEEIEERWAGIIRRLVTWRSPGVAPNS